MGYRTNERLPLIAQSPNNQGLYFDLYSLAAKNTGCSLLIKRLPKRRINRQINQGFIDFYPGLNISQTRLNNLIFMKNGLTRWNIGISRKSMPDINNNLDLQEKLQGKSLLISKGGAILIKDTAGIDIKPHQKQT